VNNQNNSMLVLCYHSISESTEDRIDPSIIVSPVNFEKQLAFLAASAQVISLADYVDALHSNRPLPRNAVVLTFDDGYRDNWATALPLLRKFGLPATFLLATDYIGKGPKWEDRLTGLIHRSTGETVTLDLETGRITIDIRDERAKHKAIIRLLALLSRCQPSRREQVLAELHAQSHADIADFAQVMMTWDQAREVAAAPGMTIGAHTVSHPHLNRVPDDQVREEITASKQTVEEQIGKPVRFFCYPYGDYDARTIRSLQDNGFECAGTLFYGSNTLKTDPFQLKRIQAPNENGLRLRIGLQLRKSRFGEQLKQAYNLMIHLA
jgi:peptidoglycan/xylan/chitin deacetylase (PgdA/CDA1 family)